MADYFKELKGDSVIKTSDLLVSLLKARVKISDGTNPLAVYDALIKRLEDLNNSKT